MSILFRNVSNAIWHAYNALHSESDRLVNKSKLKVLTANIASIWNFYGIEKDLEKFLPTTNALSFEHFHYYLEHEVFSTLSENLSISNLRDYEQRIEELCWLVCRSKYILIEGISLNDSSLHKLFRIFCLLSDMNNQREVLLSSSEAKLVLQQIMSTLGMDFENNIMFENLQQQNSFYTFEQFLKLISFAKISGQEEYQQSLHEAIEELFQTFIKDIIKKGYIFRRGYLIPTFKEYWFVLQPYELSYYKSHSERELCGSIQLDGQSKLKTYTSIVGKSEKLLKFSISCGDRCFELATYDHSSRMRWIASIQLAISYSTGKQGYQRDLISLRRKKREAEIQKERDDENQFLKQLQEMKLTQSQLEEEKRARIAAEFQAKQFAEVAKKDSRKVAELEDMKLNLEKLLEEEIQAKHDEEIVRALQARVLAEEWNKREELERLQKEQEILLDEEIKKRINFENQQKEKEIQLKEAENKLKQLESERKKLDMQLKQARFKIIRSEENKGDLEARMDAMRSFFNPNNNNYCGIRRTLSFVVPSRERPTALEIRSSFKNGRQTKCIKDIKR